MIRRPALDVNRPRGWRLRSFFLLTLPITLLPIGCDVPRVSTAFKGSPAPPFEITAFNGEFDGRRFSLDQLHGNIVVLNFWASWCAECEYEMPVLEEAWRAFRERGVWFIGVDYMDFDEDAASMLKRYRISYPNGPDRGAKNSKRYRVSGVPETIFIDENGIVQEVQIGRVNRVGIREVIERMLSQSRSEAPRP